MKADFVARNEDGTYKEDSLNIAWFGYRACAKKADVRVEQDALRIAQLEEVRSALYDRCAALEARIAELERWRDLAFEAHPNIDVDIAAVTGETP